jgi:hypothetical protein
MDDGLSDGFVRVRPHRLADVDAIYEAAIESVAELSPWMGWCRADLPRSEIADYLAQGVDGWKTGERYPMVIEDSRSGRLLGSSGLNDVRRHHGTANLGYWVRTSAAGCGVATRAARLVAIVGCAISVSPASRSVPSSGTRPAGGSPQRPEQRTRGSIATESPSVASRSTPLATRSRVTICLR